MPRHDSNRQNIVRTLLSDPVGRVIALPILALETSARFLRERTVLAAVLSGGGLAIAISARAGAIQPPEGLSSDGLVVAGVLGIMATLWLLEVIPVAATALLPLVLFPLLGVSTASEVAGAWGSSTILLLLGSFMLAQGVERWGVPEVLGGFIDRWAVGSPRRTMLGLMVVTVALGAWLSNTATALVMITVAQSVVRRARDGNPDQLDEVRKFQKALLLGIGFAATLSGLETPVASPPNLVLMGLAGDSRPSFLQWMAFGIPIVVVALPVTAWILMNVVYRFPKDLKLAPGTGATLDDLSQGGRRVIAVFGAVVVLWLTRADLSIGSFFLPGWSSALGLTGMVDDATVAIAGALALFMLPSGDFAQTVRRMSNTGLTSTDNRPVLVRALEELSRDRLLTWESARDIPWHLLLLFGGGLALADAFQTTGLGAWLGAQAATLDGIPVWAMVVVVTVGISILTEVTSSTAVASVFLPVLLAVSESLGLPVLTLMWPAAFATSASFLFPISTPPNAIAAGAGDISFFEMAKAGILIKIVTVALVVLASLYWMPVVLRM